MRYRPCGEQTVTGLVILLRFVFPARTIENKAKNDEEIATKTFVNGQSGEFGPFSRYGSSSPEWFGCFMYTAYCTRFA